MDIKQVVSAAFSQPQRCYGHCDQNATFRFLTDGEPLLACYACPRGYVSKVMAYGGQNTAEGLRNFLGTAFEGRTPIREDDLRVAKRHPWDLGIAGAELNVTYWTQNYRSSKSNDPDRPALFLCSKCGSAYVKPISGSGTLCPSCSS
ncbi:MAG: hypothetical protein LYZ70_01845 [Nitrososphaerales archaeon]|nr:hypothetical protein [Nitrososphaerales archaeon]